MITAEIYAHVKPAVQLIMQDLNGELDRTNIQHMSEQVYTRLWSYVTHAVKEEQPEAAPSPEPPDRRAKPWQITVRFWNITPIGPALIGETDPEIIVGGTGKLPGKLANYAAEMHDGNVPHELLEAQIKERLPQLRNNLGRQGKAVLRTEYKIGDEPYICQVDVEKP